MEKKRVFLCGKITGDPDYRFKFRRAETMLTNAGYHVMNPALLPGHGFNHREYMTVTLAMLSVCDEVFYLGDCSESPGAMEELERATLDGKPTHSFEMWVAESRISRREPIVFD